MAGEKWKDQSELTRKTYTGRRFDEDVLHEITVSLYPLYVYQGFGRAGQGVGMELIVWGKRKEASNGNERER